MKGGKDYDGKTIMKEMQNNLVSKTPISKLKVSFVLSESPEPE